MAGLNMYSVTVCNYRNVNPTTFVATAYNEKQVREAVAIAFPDAVHHGTIEILEVLEISDESPR